MCELLGSSSRRPYVLRIALDEFARHGGRDGPYGDGWGAAFYESLDVHLFREPMPASSSRLMALIEEEGLPSCIAMAHIRRASRGAIALRNSQPFVRELGGRTHAFAHNGDLGRIFEHPRMKLGVHRPIGETDSEHAFCALLCRLEPLWLPDNEGTPSLQDRFEIVSKFACELPELGPANFLYSDGEALFVFGDRRRSSQSQGELPGLYHLNYQCQSPPIDLQGGVSIDPHHEGQTVHLFASVPLTDEAWAPVVRNRLLCAVDGRLWQDDRLQLPPSSRG